jgi:glycosyltransferase involved in cell wall biosynthesis
VSTGSVTFSVIVPTSGRRTLPGALASVAPQLRPGDEILVQCNRDHDYGAKARNDLMARSHGPHLLFLDDDDEYLPTALDAFRSWAEANPGRIGIFRERLVDGTLHWKTRDFRIGNVGTVIFCVPNIPEKLGVWGIYGDDWAPTDWVFVSATAEKMGDPIFVDKVIARQRPRGEFATPLDRLRFALQPRMRLKKLAARRASAGN